MLSVLFLWGCGDSASFNVATKSDVFGQQVTYNHMVDILWVVDNSGSMENHQANLSAQMDTLFNTLLATNLDFRIAAVTTDMRSNLSFPENLKAEGRFIGTTKIIDRNTADIQAAFSSMIQPGITGSTVERGLDAMVSALSEPLISNENAGFFRDQALLAVIFVSDEDDSSVNSSSDAIDFLEQLKPRFPSGNQAWVANFIGVTELNNPNCTTLNQYSAPGWEYMNLVNASGGKSTTICSADLTDALFNVKERIVEILTEFRLGRKPRVETIEVLVNGVSLANDAVNGWTYYEENMSIRFHGDGVPPAGAVIKINYKPIL